MPITTFASVDVGSYETSMKIFEISKKFGMREINHVRYRLELGKDSYRDGKFKQEALEELCRVLLGFKQIM